MSSYEYYEFQAIDRPLTSEEIGVLRRYSSRAVISPTRFVNSYSFGSFKGDEAAWMEKYFDAFLFLANGCTRQLMLRLPRRFLDPNTAHRYLCGDSARVRVSADALVLSLVSEDEDGYGWVEEDEGSGWMASLLQVRAELLAGDLRALFLGWLLCVQAEELDEDAMEPPVPPGLGELSEPQRALADFLRIDGDLLAAAASGSPPAPSSEAEQADLERWVAALPAAEKSEILLRLVRGEAPHLRAELNARFQRSRPQVAARTRSRSVGELLKAAELLRDERLRLEAEQKRRDEERRLREEREHRDRRLDLLARRQDAAWSRIDELIEARAASRYNEAIGLLRDLRDLAERSGEAPRFFERTEVMRAQHAKKTAFVDRLRKAALLGPA